MKIKKVYVIISVILIAVFLFFWIYKTPESYEEGLQKKYYFISDNEYFGTKNYKEHDISTDLVINDENISEMILTLLNASYENETIPTQYNDNILSDVYKSLSPLPQKLNTPFWSKCDFSILSIKYTKTKMVVDYYYLCRFSYENNDIIEEREVSYEAPPRLYLEYIGNQWVIIKQIPSATNTNWLK